MNKFAKVMCMIAVVALAFTSCKKKEEDGASFMMNGSTQQFEQVFDEEVGAKAYLNSNNQMQFETGDEMYLFNYSPTIKKYNRYQYNASTNQWTVTGTYNGGFTGSGATCTWYAFYPAESLTSFDLFKTTTNNEEHAQGVFHLNNTQNYRTDASGNVMVSANDLYMAAKDVNNWGSMTLQFKNICGILSMKFYSPTGKKVTSIDVKDNKFNLVGDVTCYFDKIDQEDLLSWCNNYQDTESYNTAMYYYLRNDLGYSIENAHNTITLNCENAVALGADIQHATRFLIVMRPLALLKGATITIHFSNAPDVIIETTRDNRIAPNMIREMTVYNVG